MHNLPPQVAFALIAYGIVILVGLIASGRTLRCARCGKPRAGRWAGGTLDEPICIYCIDKDE